MRRDAHTAMADSDEPCTIDCQVVAAVLEECHRPRMADYVRGVGEQIRRLIRERDELRERLHRHETPAPVSVGNRTYRAKPESDG